MEKSQMQQSFEAWYKFQIHDDMEIQTAVAWDDWQVAWAAAHHAIAPEADDATATVASVATEKRYKYGAQLFTKKEAKAWASNPMFFPRASASMKKTEALAILRHNIDEIQFWLKQDKALADGFVLGHITTKTFVLAANRLHDWRVSMEIMSSGAAGRPHLWEE